MLLEPFCQRHKASAEQEQNKQNQQTPNHEKSSGRSKA
jgi:hypothetical protein